MIKLIMVLLIMVFNIFISASQEMVNSDTVNYFSMPGFVLTNKFSGRLNYDNIDDYVLIFDQVSLIDDSLNKRFVVLLISDIDMYHVIKNDKLVYFFSYDKNFPDSLVDIYMKDHKLFIEQYGGFVHRWGRETIFNYSIKTKTILFEKDIFTIFDSNSNQEIIEERVINAIDYQVVFDTYDIYQLPDVEES